MSSNNGTYITCIPQQRGMFNAAAGRQVLLALKSSRQEQCYHFHTMSCDNGKYISCIFQQRGMFNAAAGRQVLLALRSSRQQQYYHFHVKQKWHVYQLYSSATQHVEHGSRFSIAICTQIYLSAAILPFQAIAHYFGVAPTFFQCSH
jgi:hypothetical protein